MGLSQEQINALLEGTGTFDSPATAAAPPDQGFFLKFSTIAMEAGSVAVSQALGKTVTVSHPEISLQQFETLQHELPPHQVMIRTGYLIGEEIPSLLLLKDYDVAVIFDILMGKDGRNPDLDISDLQISAIGEVMNQLMGAAATALSQAYRIKISMKAPESQLIHLNAPSGVPAEFLTQPLLMTKYNFVIEGVLDSELYELRTQAHAETLKQRVTAFIAPPPSTAAPPTAHAAPSLSSHNLGTVHSDTPGYASPSSPSFSGSPLQASPSASVRPAEFSPLSPGYPPPANPSLERIVDIPLRVTVELGSTKLKIKNILDLTKGSVVELDKLAGEPVDMLVNGKLMAKGEVVVINENFGIRITEILGPSDRLNHLRSD